ncbi:hypothetical protein BOX15_Mlig020739g1 [Macrostomum lignano]|uniref:PDZ domain-containing protein n=3 Tax=Macrostomum lignano TaxID=282301 RepID=A0A267EWE0_9PLAT|nr:hypothetical protein BOX15_Mlig020739g1 [Macrostomum lignano]
MYFCDDHGSAYDDGTDTVRSYRGHGEGEVESRVEGDPEQLPSSPPQSPAINGEVAAAAARTSPPVLQQPQPLHLDLSAAAATAKEVADSDRGDSTSLDDPASSGAESSSGGGGVWRVSERRQRDHQQQQLPPPPSKPPPLPINGLHRAAAAGDGSGGGTAYILQAAAAAAAAATAGCGFQEVREISLGRHNDEPYGMKVEAIGEAFFITHVVRNSVAACAGLKIGDEIVRINERRLEGLRTREVLQAIRLSELCVKLAYKPRAVVARIREIRLQKDNGVLGLRLQKKPDGLYIDFVKRGTSAHEAGLKDGDQVLKINSHIVTDWSMEGAMALLKSLSDTEPIALLVRETLPVANLAGTGPTPLTLPLPSHNKHRNQQAQTLQRQSDEAKSQNSRHHQQGEAPVDGAEPDEPTSSAAPAAANAVPTEKEENRRPKVPDSNPCASTDDLEITRLRVPPEAAGEAEAAAAAAGGPSTSGGNFSASNFFKSFHAPNRLTAFLKSSRFSRQQSQPQSKQQQSDAKANTSLPAVEASISAEKGT